MIPAAARACRSFWTSRSAPYLTELGWRVEDLIGLRHDQIAFYRPPAQGWRGFHDTLARRQPFRDLEFQVCAQSGSAVIWVSLSGRARFDDDANYLGCYSGAMAQSPSDAAAGEMTPGDLESARRFGERIASVADRFRR